MINTCSVMVAQNRKQMAYIYIMIVETFSIL